MEHRIIISGSGGQGVLFGGILIARAAMIEGKHVTFFPSYGAEIRGGAAMSSVVISDEPIGSPVIKTPDSLIILNDVSFRKFIPLAVEKTIIIFNDSIIKSLDGALPPDYYPISASDISMKKIGDVRTANVVMAGYWAKILSSVNDPNRNKKNPPLRIESLEAACLAVSKTPAGGALNKKALYEGYNYNGKI